jgi:hypothetical protein
MGKWQDLGRAMKRAGKLIGNQSMIDKGREWQYGHLPPDQLMQQHPSAFLRKYAVQSKIEHPEHVGLNASQHATYQLRGSDDTKGNFHGMNHISDSSGVRRQASGHYHLVFQGQADEHRDVFTSTQVGGDFHAAFLPMRQAKSDDFGGKFTARSTSANVHSPKTGRITDTQQANAEGQLTLTTQLSGCTIAKRKDNMMHLRPDADGGAMQDTMPREQTFGRRDYPAPGEEAFVMMRRKPDGRTRLYYQKHNPDTGEMVSGKKDFPVL